MQPVTHVLYKQHAASRVGARMLPSFRRFFSQKKTSLKGIGDDSMNPFTRLLATISVCATPVLPQMAAAQTAPAIPQILITPDTVDTRIGKLEFKDGAPSVETAEKVSDTLDCGGGLSGGHLRQHRCRA